MNIEMLCSIVGAYSIIGFIVALKYSYSLLSLKEELKDHLVYILCGPFVWILYVVWIFLNLFQWITKSRNDKQ